MANFQDLIKGLLTRIAPAGEIPKQSPQPNPGLLTPGVGPKTPPVGLLNQTLEDKQAEERRGFFFTNVSPYELDNNQRKRLTEGDNYKPTRVNVKGKVEKFWTIGPGVKLDQDNVDRINKLAGDRIILDKNFINSKSRVPQDIVDKVALQKWDNAVNIANQTLGANNPANYIYASMVYQLGPKGAGEFKDTINQLKKGTAEGYKQAEKKVAESDWNKQTPVRVEAVQRMLKDLASFQNKGR